MKVRRLEISGFKSFADRTVMDFPDGMCAVVGPNGCGKSNVVDAVRWVLGEQSMKQLRGHTKEDVIFNGSEGRKPSGSAEVSLVFENNGSVTHPHFADLPEIMISRRLYRNGDMDYLINKVPCRLKDIQQLLMDTGLGNRAYAIIEQGRVAAFIEAKPVERRLWVEEAAGITRYKNQKKISLRKMQSAQDNLDRLQDIVLEVETQMTRLQRQAKKAQKHQELRKNIRELDLNIASHEFNRLSTGLSDLSSESDAVGAQLLLANQRVTGLETDQETLKVHLVQAEQNIAESGDLRLATQGKIQKAENELTLLSREAENQRRLGERYSQEKTSLEQKSRDMHRSLTKARNLVQENALRLESTRTEMSRAASQVARRREALAVLESRVEEAKDDLVERISRVSQIKNRLGDLERARGEQARRLEQVGGRQGTLERERDALALENSQAAEDLLALHGELVVQSCHLAQCRQRAQTVRAQLKELEAAEGESTRQVHSLQAAVSALEASLTSFEWAGSGVRKVLSESQQGRLPAKVLGLVAEHLDVEPGCEPLVEAALGPDLQAVVVPDGSAAKALAAWAAQQDLGRVRVVSLADLKTPALPAPQGSQGISAHARPRPGFEALAALLAGAGWRQDLPDAWQAATDLAPGQSLVTPAGERLDRPGAALVGSGGPAQGSVLAQRNALALRREELQTAQSRLSQLSQSRKQAQAEMTLLDQDSSSRAAARNEGERALAQAGQMLQRLAEGISAKRRALEGLEFDAAEIASEAQRTSGECERLAVELSTCHQESSQLEAQLAQRQEEVSQARDGLEEAREEQSQAQLAAANTQTQTEHAKSDAMRLESDSRQVDQRIDSLGSEISSAQQAVEEFTIRREREQVTLGHLYEDLEKQQAEHTRARELLSQAQMQSSDLDQNLKQARSEQRRVEAASNELALRQKELELQRENLCEQVRERCRADLAACWQDCLPSGSFDSEASREKLNKLRTRLMRLGPVNMEAITEHETLQERHGFLTEQKADLEASLEDLRQAIRKINSTSRTRFLDTLKAVNERLQGVFPVLFGGGQAQLTLEEGVDALEAGLHLMVELPGKKLKHVESLSGGEKALSAGAVLFSLFLIKPAPFCILDEVDAPLDEANISRFHDLLTQMSQRSQIVAVTHNRRTMEMVDTLYGVTMEERGVSKILSVDMQTLAA